MSRRKTQTRYGPEELMKMAQTSLDKKYSALTNPRGFRIFHREGVFYYSPRMDYVHIYFEISQKELRELVTGELPDRLKNYEWCVKDDGV